MKKIGNETIFGGIFGAIAIIATIIQMSISGFSQDAVWSGIKDLSATMVGVAVLIMAMKNFFPKKPVTFEKALDVELKKWVERSFPLVHRAKDCPEKIRYYLITKTEKILTMTQDELQEIEEKGSVNSGTFNGKFVEFPLESKKRIVFFLNASTFKERANVRGKSYEDTLSLLASQISNNINKKFSDVCRADAGKDTISVTFHKEPNKVDDAKDIVKLIDHVLSLYCIAT